MKKLLIPLLSFIFIFLVGSFVLTKANALTVTFPEYDVDIEVLENGSIEITESAMYEFNGYANGFRRDIPLRDVENEALCDPESSSFIQGLSCGGFELIFIEEVVLDGKTLDEDEYDVYIVTDEYTGDKDFRIEKRLWDEETYVTDEQFEIDISYTILGGILEVPDTDRDIEIPVFYWNIFPDTDGIEEARFRIELPENVRENRINLFTNQVSESDIRVNDNVISSKVLSDISSRDTVTLSYAFFNPDAIEKSGTVEVEIGSPAFANELFVAFANQPDREFFMADTEKTSLDFLPAGEYELIVKNSGYHDYRESFEIDTSDELQLEVSLEPAWYTALLLWIGRILMVAGIISIPFAIWLGIRRFNKHGRDEQMPATIVPEYQPPKDTPPYLLGSLKDEKVDREDISGTIIDLAYRGFITIKEDEKRKKNFILNKVKHADGSELSEIEKELLDTIFGSKETKEIKDFTYSFVTKLQKIEQKIYDEMVSKNFFKDSPKKIRERYTALSIGVIIAGLALAIGVSVGLSLLVKEYMFFTLGLAIFVYGLVLIVFARFMPAKTPHGSKVFAHVLGFKMYMETAERYRVQNLTPETFEKFLSYAVVFKIEKQWAEKFKDIYNKVPDWYEGSTMHDALYWGVLANNFNTATTSQINKVVAAHNAARGSGSSGTGSFGGGSFGGFSGGGGGGGSAGGW